jgi:hypothetical protein
MKILCQARSRAVQYFVLFALGAAYTHSALASVYPAWQDGGTYAAGAVVSYNGHDYRARTSQTDTLGAGWNPVAAPSLWLDIGMESVILSSSGYPVWQDGGTYQVGAIVYYNGHIYKARQTQTDYLGAGWNPVAAASLWQDLGVSANVDKPLLNAQLSVGAGSQNTTNVSWNATSPTMFNLGSLHPGQVTVPTVEWQVLDGGAQIFASHDYSYSPPTQLPGCDPLPGSPPCNRDVPPRISGFKVLYLMKGVHNLAVRVCDSVGNQCYITPSQAFTVATSPVVPLQPLKPTFSFEHFLDSFGNLNLRPVYSTALTSNPAQLADSALITVASTGMAPTPIWGGGTVTITVTSGCPSLPNGQRATQCFYNAEHNPATDLPVTPIAIGSDKHGTFTYVLSLCNTQGSQCTKSDPVVVTVP